MKITSIGNSTNDQLGNNTIVDSNLFYGSLFEYNPDTVFFMDIHGIIAKGNGRFSRMLGYSQKEIELCPLEQFLPNSGITSYKELFIKAITGETQHVYTSLLSKNGNKVYISLNLIPARFEDRVIGVFAIAKDITDKKKAEMKLEESELKFDSIVDEALIGVYIVENRLAVFLRKNPFVADCSFVDVDKYTFFKRSN